MSWNVARRGIAVALALGLAVSLGPVGSARAQTPKKGGTLVYASVSGPGTLDPYMASSAVELEVINNIFEGLVTLDNANATRPMLATKATASTDFKTYSFELRKGVKFHNGQEMTSADVKASFERYKRISPNAKNLDAVDRFETPDPYSFVIVLKEPNVVLLDVIKSPIYPLMILPASQKDKPARDIEVIGTGPFKLGEWVKDSHLTITRFDDYTADTSVPGRDGYGGRKTVYLDGVRYRFMPEATTRIAALQNGEAQMISSVPSELAARVTSRKDLAIREVFPTLGSYVIVNSQKGLTANVLIRQAIAAAINVDDIIEGAGGINKRNPWMSFPGTPYFLGDTAPTPWYDIKSPARAKELLKQAGYKGEKIVIETNSNYQWMRSTMLIVAEQLKEAGMTVDVQVTDWTTNASHMQQGTGDWNLSTTAFGPDHILGPQQWRPVLYTFPHIVGNEILDKAYAEFFAAPTLEARRASWLTIQKEVLGGGYLVKIADTGRLTGYAKKLQGQNDYAGILQLWDLWLD
ncbi:ABC transporter substrate-binding protein [Bradyrhizobium sp. MOS002]|jgi:peptide/nickel transport system substrate-binding protein|uniref:ABC transporter substrate-binding protein n=1 Tax=Bradyrhizobium sp. MOS002 TaxID=2133947 RepID=UPI000D13C77E|nr:ABC transporter substrate-binding protein [Bradyrhizobium sp. MOS002]PSO26919.1 peptide ABC transporter substrate-binding protein [Bradyrhizobium sp. MOS002]